jgi:hypothetical protein
MDGETRFKGARKIEKTRGWTRKEWGLEARKMKVAKQKKVSFFFWW